MATLLPLLLLLLPSSSTAESEADALLRFRDSLTHVAVLSAWNNSLPPCDVDRANWVGILCDQGSVKGLQLHGLGLSGEVNVDALSKLPNLRTISLMNNNFHGVFPNFSMLPMMKTLYLSNNKFSGLISPNFFAGMEGLKKLHLANNQFIGPIPVSLAALPKLSELMLQNNQFEGEIPPFEDGRMKAFNVSNNQLNGQIPKSLSSISASAFEGNRYLCGDPLESCSSPDRLSLWAKILVAVLVAAALLALIAVFIILRHRKQLPEPALDAASLKGGDLERMEEGQLVVVGEKPGHSRKKSEPSVKITFLREDRGVFDMADLLRASAEILGSGAIGSTYKADMQTGQILVVKRFKQMNNLNKEEFHEHMGRLGRLNHGNVLPIIGFYYRKEEKLLVTDYAQRVSLASHLHAGNQSRNNRCPDWATRLKIVKGVAAGLVYLHKELPGLTVPHGHLKSSNVLLDASYNPLLTDYGLVPVVNQEQAHAHMICYKCPEYKRSRRITKKTDVWSMGILIVEVLTGRFPSSFLQQIKGGDTDITSWVESVVQDEEDGMEVFDKDMERSKKAEGEMRKLLKIGLRCCHVDVEMRPDIREAAQMIEEVKEIEC